ncbi:snoRNA-binding rRNA-processing protein utp10 [Steccherinum ochraceum]|uniref:U3 small nucleolar RNA-associated protein 10 n=1 Tax=Steccherinum ochraceum TaxID=92696 RepID=A0A4R0RP72_9APHY|nr:snoRNA-binding rRNA-processing protein utp10 [Steccherinum ochraceum]
MPSSLAQQLAQNTSLNTSLLVDRTRRKPTESYLFTGKDADHHDLDSIHALAVNAFLQLAALEPELRAYEAKLFSESAKVMDRTLQPAALNDELNDTLKSFLPLLGPFLMEVPTGKVIEWLADFPQRIHEFNVNAVLSLFLPYHESPHFLKMLSIVHIPETSPFVALLSYKSTSTTSSRTALVNMLLSHTNSDFARFAAGLLPAALRTGSIGVHRTLIAFHTGVLFDFVKRSQDRRTGKGMDEGTAAWYLPAVVEPMQLCATVQVESSKENLVKETILASFLLACAFSHTSPLSPATFAVIMKTMVSCAERVSTQHLIRSIVALCAGQTEVSTESITKSVVKAIVKLDGADVELKEVLTYAGSEKFVSGLLSGLILRLQDDQYFNLVLSLLPTSNLPSLAVATAASGLIHVLISENEDEEAHQVVKDRARAVLVQIQQRHPVILQQVFDDIMSGESADKNVLEQALLSLSLGIPTTSNTSAERDMVVASANADGAVRAIAVRDLFKTLSSGGLSDEEIASARTALLTRVQDSNAAVLEALYADPSALLPVLLDSLDEYVSTLARALESVSRSILKHHMGFVATHLYLALSSRPEWQDRIVHELIFTFLLFSKPRQKAAAAVWEILSTEKAGLASHPLLAGCVDIVQQKESSETKHTGDHSAQLNGAVASQIAGNIVASNSFVELMGIFLSKLQSESVYVRILGHMVLRDVLKRLSGEQQVNAGYQVIEAMGISSLADAGDLFSGIGDVSVLLEDVNLDQAIYSKPNSKNTLLRLQCAIVAMVPTWTRPTGATLGWLDTGSVGYVNLMRAVYRLVNSSANAASFSSYVMRSLFITLAEDTLSFLAGIWLHTATSPDAVVLTYVSLYHAAAFLEAHNAAQHTIDFQTIVPALLVAVQHTDRRVREAALQCVAALSRLSNTKKPVAVYAYDVIYGASSTSLLYLDWSDLTRYIQALASSMDHLLNDATYLGVFHQQLLNPVKTDNKKDAGFKQRTLSYLLSHVNASPLRHVEVALLRCLAEVSSPTKMQSLASALESLPSHKTADAENHIDIERYASLLVSSIDGSSLKDLNDPNGPSWANYKTLVFYYFRPGSPSLPRQTMAHSLRKAIFSGLSTERKVEVCQWFLQLGHGNAELAKQCRIVLGDIVTEVPIAVQLLSILQPTADAAERASKRSKVDPALDSTDVDTLSSLTLLAELLGSKKFPGSVDLVSALLDTLTKVVHDAPSTESDKVFVEQLLMSALENVALSMPDGSSLPPTVRLDVLAELIRVSESPQTFNQALLLIATLARLAPNAILHNIMPIFTFMGSNVFHRDDSYSFKVVQKTVDNIVPVMAASLKDQHPERLEMLVASRAFLRIFTDASNHIPRHRRTSFFTQLVDALGAADFLAPVCMLLIDKVSNKVARQSAVDAQNSLYLPLSILERYPMDLRLQTVLELLFEAQRLVKADTNPSDPSTRFLEVPLDEDASSTVSFVRRQALSLLSCAGHALSGLTISTVESEQDQTPGVSSGSQIISLLLDFATLKDSKTPADDVVKLARLAIGNTLRAMPAKQFVQGVLVVLQSGISVQEGALDLLGEQLPKVAAETRSGLVKIITSILELIRKLLVAKSDTTIVIASFHAVDAVASTMCPGEESALGSIVPIALGYVRDDKCVPEALTALHTSVVKLGPRVIPYFKDAVRACIGVLRRADDSDTSADDDASPTSSALGILQALLSSIPKFWSNFELSQVIDLYLDSQTPELASFLKTVSKRAQPKVLLPLLADIWSTLSTSRNKTTPAKMRGYFGFLKKCIRSSPRDVVTANLRALFNGFLSAFEVCASVPELLHQIKDDVLSAFLELVVKLNEATFRPLFRRIFDWAFASEPTEGRRNLVFMYTYNSLLEYFKGLMTSYMTLLLPPFLAILNQFKIGSSSDEELWLAVSSTLTKTFLHDEGAFWRDDKYKQLLPSLVGQIGVAAHFNSSEARATVSDCLLALTGAVQGDATLKSINLDVLMQTRSEDVRVRVLALQCSEALWRSHGGKLMGFVPETATFIAEAAEDANDTVVKEAHRLKDTVEALAGKIDV